MGARISVLANFTEDLLQKPKLVWNKWEISCKIFCPGESLDVKHAILEREQVSQNRIVRLVNRAQRFGRFGSLFQDSLLNDFVCRTGRQRKTGLETRLDSGEFVFASLDDFVNRLLPGANHPNLALALAPDFFDKGLQVQKQIGIRAHILADFIDHKEQAVILGLLRNIFLNFFNKRSDAEFRFSLVGYPFCRFVFGHAKNLRHRLRNRLTFERKSRLTGRNPILACNLFKCVPELLRLAFGFYVLFQAGNFQVFAIKAQETVEHLGKNAQDGSPVLVRKSFDIDIEKNRVGRGL